MNLYQRGFLPDDLFSLYCPAYLMMSIHHTSVCCVHRQRSSMMRHTSNGAMFKTSLTIQHPPKPSTPLPPFILK